MEMIMDPNRWKSVAVRIEDYKKLKQLAKKEFRAPAGTIGFLLHEYLNKNN
tara:strand:- start:327 stop:479 length:153 start_codon:yes stop_codon:yes gene_type:complete